MPTLLILLRRRLALLCCLWMAACGASAGGGGSYADPNASFDTIGGPDTSGGADTAGGGETSGGSDGGGSGSDAAADTAGAGGDLVVTKGHTTTGQTWTVLVYLDGDNDLEPFAVQDMLEMAQVGSSDKVKIVVQVDRAAGHSNEPIGNLGDFTDTRRVVVHKGSFEQVATIGEADRTDPNTLAEFLAWGLTSYPADRVALVLWNHGGGTAGFANDDSAGEGKMMAVQQIGAGIQQGLAKAGRERLDLVGFDACLMATFEVAATLAPYAEYLLASEELEPGHGWNWTSLQALRDNPGLGAAEFGKRIADDFLAYGKDAGTDAGITLSLFDLTELDAVGDAVDAIATAIGTKLPGVTLPLAQARAKAFEFGKSGPTEPGMNAFDLGQFAFEAEKVGAIDGSLRASLNAALGKAIVYKVAGTPLGFATGMTITFPPQQAQDAVAMSKVPGVANWRAMLEAFWIGGQAAAKAEFAAKDGIAVAKWQGGTLLVSGDLVPGAGAALVEASAVLGIVDAQAGQPYLLVSGPAEVTGDVVHTDWDGQYLELTDGKVSAPAYTEIQEVQGGTLLQTILLRQAGTEYDIVVYRVFLPSDGAPAQTKMFLFNDDAVGEYVPVLGQALMPLALTIDENQQVVPVATNTDGFNGGNLSFKLAKLDPSFTLMVVLTATSADGSTDNVAVAVPQNGGSTGPACGDGACNGGESTATCPADCKPAPNPNSCAGRCGQYDPDAPCQCDAGCQDGGDCCADIDQVCP